LTARATPRAASGGLVGAALLGIALLMACVPCARAAQPAVSAPVSARTLSDYIAGVARAWEPYTTAAGVVEDPLNAGDTSDNYGVIMLADVMLKVARVSPA